MSILHSSTRPSGAFCRSSEEVARPSSTTSSASRYNDNRKISVCQCTVQCAVCTISILFTGGPQAIMFINIEIRRNDRLSAQCRPVIFYMLYLHTRPNRACYIILQSLFEILLKGPPTVETYLNRCIFGR